MEMSYAIFYQTPFSGVHNFSFSHGDETLQEKPHLADKTPLGGIGHGTSYNQKIRHKSPSVVQVKTYPSCSTLKVEFGSWHPVLALRVRHLDQEVSLVQFQNLQSGFLSSLVRHHPLGNILSSLGSHSWFVIVLQKYWYLSHNIVSHNSPRFWNIGCLSYFVLFSIF